MTAEYIFKFATACASVYGTRDPIEIFRQRSATVRHGAPDGDSGMICAAKGKVTVCLADDLSEPQKRAVASHLLGHAVLHRKRIMSGKVYEEPLLGDAGGPAELEADLFAAELLITDDEVETLFKSGMSEGQIVSSFGTLRELVIKKLFSMRSRGKTLGEDSCRADFLRRCDVELFN